MLQVRKVLGINNMKISKLYEEIDKGGRFVMYHTCYSFITVTITTQSDIYFIKKGDRYPGVRISAILKSIFFGWWGMPWGPLRMYQAIKTDLQGGEDVTDQVLTYIESIRIKPIPAEAFPSWP